MLDAEKTNEKRSKKDVVKNIEKNLDACIESLDRMNARLDKMINLLDMTKGDLNDINRFVNDKNAKGK